MGSWDSWRRGLAGVVVAAAVCGTSAPARAEEHKDERLGYSFTYPRKWLKRPVSVDGGWVVAKFESDREFEDSDPKLNTWTRHRPWIDVVTIPLKQAEKKGGTVEKGGDGEIRLRLTTPPKDLKEYLEKELPGQGGFFFSKEDDVQVNGLRCVQYEVTFEKLVDTPKRVHAWAYYTEDAIYGFVGETLIKFEEKVKPDLMAAFKSFKAFQRTGALPGAETTGSDVVLSTGDDNLDDDMRKRKREERVMKRLARIKDSLGDDWTIKESEHFIAVSHADAKYTKQMLDHCENVRAWLDKNLGYVGTGYAGRIIIRICKDTVEDDALRKTAGWSGGGLEVLTYKDREGLSGWGPFDFVNGGIFDIWLRDKNESLTWSMPSWISSGLRQLICTAESKGKSVEFRPATWDRVRIATQRRDGKLHPAKAFFTMTSQELWKDWETANQQEFFVRYLMVGNARKNPKFKNLLADYLKAVVFVIDEREAARVKAMKKEKEAAEGAEPPADDEPKDEKEEEERLRKQREEWGKDEKQFLDTVYQRVFSSWTVKDWEALNASYWKELE